MYNIDSIHILSIWFAPLGTPQFLNPTISGESSSCALDSAVPKLASCEHGKVVMGTHTQIGGICLMISWLWQIDVFNVWFLVDFWEAQAAARWTKITSRRGSFGVWLRGLPSQDVNDGSFWIHLQYLHYVWSSFSIDSDICWFTTNACSDSLVLSSFCLNSLYLIIIFLFDDIEISKFFP